MSEPRVTYVGAKNSTPAQIILKCLTCLDRPVVTDTDLHEQKFHPRKG